MSQNDNENKNKGQSKGKGKGKRGRPKKIGVIANNDNRNILNENVVQRDIIVHLPGISLNSTKEITKEAAAQTVLNENKNQNKTIIDSLKLKVIEPKQKKEVFNKYVFSVTENIYKQMNIEFVNKETGMLIDLENNTSVCWWCTHDFDTYPCFLPESYYEEKFYIQGYFCSFNCATAYNINLNDFKVGERLNLMKILCKKIFNIDDLPKPSPPKEILIKYGGYLSIEDYRSKNTIINKEFKISLPLFSQMIHNIEEKNVVEKKQNKN